VPGPITITVVVPVYNGGRTVLKALRSVQEQSLAAAEVIIVDDGSVDDTAELVQAFLDGHGLMSWRLVRQHNRGPAGARDTGIRLASSTHVALLDADDEWTPHKLTSSVQALEQLNLDIVGASLGNRRAAISGAECLPISRGSFLFRNPYFTSTVVFGRAAYFEVGGFDTTQRYAEDYKLWLHFVWQGKRAGLLADACASYRPDRGAGPGLSSHLWRMETGELGNYISLYRSGLLGLPMVAAACTFSLAKFLRRCARRSLRRA
jgi:glycosyltransferase involved in cell wall biosynthesis